jgi:hypothetical protein
MTREAWQVIVRFEKGKNPLRPRLNRIIKGRESKRIALFRFRFLSFFFFSFFSFKRDGETFSVFSRSWKGNSHLTQAKERS